MWENLNMVADAIGICYEGGMLSCFDNVLVEIFRQPYITAFFIYSIEAWGCNFANWVKYFFFLRPEEFKNLINNVVSTNCKINLHVS